MRPKTNNMKQDERNTLPDGVVVNTLLPDGLNEQLNYFIADIKKRLAVKKTKPELMRLALAMMLKKENYQGKNTSNLKID